MLLFLSTGKERTGNVKPGEPAKHIGDGKPELVNSQINFYFILS